MENPSPGPRSDSSLLEENLRLRLKVSELETALAREAHDYNKDLGDAGLERTKLLSVFEQAPVGIALLEGPEHVFTLANRKYLSSFFSGRADLIGKAVRAAVPEAVEQGFVDLLDRVYDTGESFIGTETPIALVQPDGSLKSFYLNFSYQAVRDQREKIHGVLAVIQDVTEQVQNRAKAEEGEKKIRTLIEALPQLVWTCRPDGETDYLSPQWVEYTGVPAAAQFNLDWVEAVIHPDDRNRVRESWMGAVREHHDYDIEYRIKRYDGEYRWFKTRAAPMRDSRGAILSWFGTCTDIHDTKETDAKLVLERALLETVFQQSPAAMVLWRGPNFIFDKINAGYQAIFTNRELLGKPFAEALPETIGQPFEQWLKQVFETGESRVEPERLAKLVLYRGGPIEDRYFDMSFVRVTGADNQPYGVYEHAVDVTDRVLSRRDLEKSKADLEKSVESLQQEREIRERFVATLTHDLRTPLTAAKMSAQLINRKATDNLVIQKLASKVTDNVDRADEMIRDLLDANLIGAGETLPIEVEPCNLNDIVADTIAELSTVHGDRFVLEADQLIEGTWSANGIRRILENLCGNAIKYGASHRPVSVSLTTAQGWANIAVKNEGAVIQPRDQANLFAPFHRTLSARTGGQKGWGLGLTLVKGLAEAHGGNVGLASSESEGTVFTVSLPVNADID